MHLFSPTIILRHRKENLKKCSLKGLNRPDILFFTYPIHPLPPLKGYVLLTLQAPPLTTQDAHLGLFLIDGTWRHTETMYTEWVKKKNAPVVLRSLPESYQTAYPRRQDDCPDPKRGLASIEALFVAYHILGRSTDGLLDLYHWKNSFYLQNKVSLMTS